MGFPESLAKLSSLTPRQLEALTSYMRVASGEMGLKEAASIASQGRRRGEQGRPLTIGSYYRTVSQAKSNIKQSLATVVIALWLGVVKTEDARRLFDLVGSGARALSDEEAERFLALLEALLRRIVM